MDSPNTKVITLKDLGEIFLRRIWIMLLAAVLSVGTLALVTGLTFSPRYSSTATLYILRQEGNSQQQTNNADSDFTLALKVVNDCTYLLKSHVVIDEVIDTMNLTESYETLYEDISTNNPDSTRILEVTVEADSPERAKAIVDNLCLIGQEKITEAMGFQQVNFYEKGTLDYEPCNRIGVLVYLIVGVIAVILTYSVFLIVFILDDHIRTDEDIQQQLGLSILGDIPNADAGSKARRYGYRAYKKYAGKRYEYKYKYSSNNSETEEESKDNKNGKKG